MRGKVYQNQPGVLNFENCSDTLAQMLFMAEILVLLKFSESWQPPAWTKAAKHHGKPWHRGDKKKTPKGLTKKRLRVLFYPAAEMSARRIY